MKCIVIDDEPLALELMEDNIGRIPFLELKAKFSNALDAIAFIKQESIDLVFLDIQMPGITGMQFLKNITNAPQVIFVTAYKNFALEGYEFNVTDFLVKPVEFERFLKACNKAHNQYLLSNSESSIQAARPYIFIHSEYSLVRIALDQICYLEGLKDYVKIYLVDQKKPILTRQNLKSMEEKLGTLDFLRVHKSYIVSLTKVDAVRKNLIRVGDTDVPLSESYKESFFEGLRRKGQII